MRILELNAVAEQPLLLANRMMDRGNLLTSEETLAGATLRGALAEALLLGHGEQEPFFQRAIVDERLSCGTLIPIGSKETQGRSAFVPHTVRVCKRYPEHAWHSRIFHEQQQCTAKACRSKLKRGSGYICGSDPGTRIRPKRQLLTSVKLDKHTESAEEGNLFSREVLVQGTCLRGWVWLEHDLDPTPLMAIKTVRVGLAKRSGFGKLSLSWRELPAPSRQVLASDFKNVNERFRSVGSQRAQSFQPNQHLVLLDLQSPLVLSDPFMRPRLKLLASDLAVYGPELQWQVLGCFGQLTQIGGWYALSNRPKTHRLAIAPGSVFALAVEGPQDKILDALSRIQLNGLGEGWGAGFGHVIVNHPIHLYTKEASR